MPGFILKALLSGGDYIFPSAGLRMDVEGILLSAAALPGWRFTYEGVSIGVYAGPLAQDYWLTPDDPASRLRGPYVGGQFAFDVWHEPSPAAMVALNGALASIGPSGSLRGAFDVRVFDALFVGPEMQGIWCVDYQELRLGAHVTGWRVDALELSGGGWVVDSERRSGPYVRLGFSARY